MVRGARYVFAALAWAFVAGLVVQVYLIGLGLFASADYKELHANFGWILHLVPPFILLAAAVARAGRTQILQTAALAVTMLAPVEGVLSVTEKGSSASRSKSPCTSRVSVCETTPLPKLSTPPGSRPPLKSAPSTAPLSV